MYISKQQTMKKLICVLLILSVAQNSFAQLVASPFDTIKKYLFINFIHSPNAGGGYRIPLDELRQNKFTNARWAKAPYCKKFMELLLLPQAQGGDQRLQEYVAYVLLLTRQKIQFNLINDSAVVLTLSTRNKYGICDWTDSAKSMIHKSWPCARVFGHPSTFVRVNCTPDPASPWGGEFTMGESFLSFYDSDQEYVRGTIVHELVHTQDWTDAAWQHYNSTAGSMVYGRDGTHFYNEVLPSNEYTFMEGLANSISFNYENGVDKFIEKIKLGDTFMVEMPPNPLAISNSCGVSVPLSADVSIFTQLITAGVDTVDRKFIKKPRRNYSYFATKSLKPRDLFFHNETVIASVFGKCLQYVHKDRFLVQYTVENMIRDYVNALDPSPYFGTLRTLSKSMVVRDVSLRLREGEELNVAPPDQTLFPMAMIDLMTYGKLTGYKEWKEFYLNSITDYWINNYLRVKSAKLIKDGKLITNPDDIAKALGLTKNGLN